MLTPFTRASGTGSNMLGEHAFTPRLSLFAVLTAIAVSLSLTGHAKAQDGTELAGDRVMSSSVGEIGVETLAQLEFPWGLAVLPGNRILITEKTGRLRIFTAGELSEPVEGVPEVVYRGANDQGGLLDVALHPDFENNQWVYLSYVEAADSQPSDVRDTSDARFGGHLDTSDDIVRGGAVARAKLDGNQLRDLEVIWRQQPKTLGRGHFGHRLLFGPDGKLYITSGERMRFDPAQNLSSNLGKVVRLNADGSIPKDNPFVDKKDALGGIWSYGHRNILAIVIRPDAGQLLTFEMGPLGGDEVNIIEPGKNYGWPQVSNGSHYNRATIPPHAGTDEYQKPIRSWTPVISPSGAMVYSNDLIPEWQGSVLVGGLSSKAIVRLEMDGNRIAVEERVDMQRRVRDLAQAPDGSIYVLVDAKEGHLLRMLPVRTNAGRPALSPESEPTK